MVLYLFYYKIQILFSILFESLLNLELCSKVPHFKKAPTLVEQGLTFLQSLTTVEFFFNFALLWGKDTLVRCY